jgi:hypothetical protein
MWNKIQTLIKFAKNTFTILDPKKKKPQLVQLLRFQTIDKVADQNYNSIGAITQAEKVS